jgi:hypothetical protein
VGWRERDWARFNDDERRALLGGGRALPPSDEGRAYPGLAPRPRPRLSSGRSRQRTSSGVLLAAAVSLAALIFVGYVKNVPVLHGILNVLNQPPRPAQVSAPQVVAPPVANPAPSVQVHAPPADVVGVHWRPQDLAPAANAGRICVTDRRHGQICASFVVGERPADNLTREIERRGLHVQSSG